MQCAPRSRPFRVAIDRSTFLGGRSLTEPSRICAPRPQRVTLSVEAYKKKGQRLMRRGADNPMMRGIQTQQQKIPDLPVDPDNEEFILFVRSPNFPRWFPYTVMKGGFAANAMAKAQGTKLGKNLYGGTLIKTIAQAFYKENQKKVRSTIRKNIPLLKYATVMEFGFKIRDREKPNEWYLTDGIQLLPPKEEVESGGILDNVKDFFAGRTKLF